MYAMYRCLSSFLLLFICAAALAQKPQPPSRDVLAAIGARGKLIYEYDQAAWHSTDAVKKVGLPQGQIDRYVAQKTSVDDPRLRLAVSVHVDVLHIASINSFNDRTRCWEAGQALNRL